MKNLIKIYRFFENFDKKSYFFKISDNKFKNHRILKILMVILKISIVEI